MSKTTIKELCRQAGITPICYYKRLEKGMTKEEALTTPLMYKRRKKQIQKVHKSFVFEDDHREHFNKHLKTYEQVSMALKNEVGLIWEDDFKRKHQGRSYPNVKIYSNADFNNALGGYRISILKHIKEGEYRFQICNTENKTTFCTNSFEHFKNEINRILTLIRGKEYVKGFKN